MIFMFCFPGMNSFASTPITRPANAYQMNVQNEMSAAIMR